MKNKVLAGILLALASCAANATPIAITGYDIENTYVSGIGGWSHTYSGTITTVSQDIADYTGGSGTLNDGVISTSVSDTQLFNYPKDSAPIITLYLDNYYSIDSILISGGDFLSNSIPGELVGLDVTIGTTTEGFVTVGQGSSNGSRFADDYIGLVGSTLEGLVTNQIILSGFDSTWGSYNTFSIAEIGIEGVLASEPVPEPAVISLFGLALVGLGFTRRKKSS